MTELIKDFEEILAKRPASTENFEESKRPAAMRPEFKPPPLPKPSIAVPLIADEQTSEFFVDLEETNSKIRLKKNAKPTAIED
jgi:hypothetical protein